MSFGNTFDRSTGHDPPCKNGAEDPDRPLEEEPLVYEIDNPRRDFIAHLLTHKPLQLDLDAQQTGPRQDNEQWFFFTELLWFT